MGESYFHYAYKKEPEVPSFTYCKSLQMLLLALY